MERKNRILETHIEKDAEGNIIYSVNERSRTEAPLKNKLLIYLALAAILIVSGVIAFYFFFIFLIVILPIYIVLGIISYFNKQ